MSSIENICARDGCGFHVELVLIADMALPAVHCGDACADYEWLRRGVDATPPTPGKAEALQTLNALERLLNGRNEPHDVGPILGALYARS